MKTTRPTEPGREPYLSMSCDIETRRPTRDRKAAHHADCAYPTRCECPAHANDPTPGESRG